MKVNLGDYKIESDNFQFIVKQEKTVTGSEKEENNGKPYDIVLGYCTSLENALKLITNKTLLENDDLQVIRVKLDKIFTEIKELSKQLDFKEYL